MAGLRVSHPIAQRPMHLALVVAWYVFFMVVFLVGLFHTKSGPSTLMLLDLLAGSACFWFVQGPSSLALWLGSLCFVHAVLISLSGIFDTGSFGNCVHTATSLTAIFCTACTGLLILGVLYAQRAVPVPLPVYESHKKTDEYVSIAAPPIPYPTHHYTFGGRLQPEPMFDDS